MSVNWMSVIILAAAFFYGLVIYCICKLNSRYDRKEEEEEERFRRSSDHARPGPRGE